MTINRADLVDATWSVGMGQTSALSSSVGAEVIACLRMPKSDTAFFNGTTPWALIHRRDTLQEHIPKQMDFIKRYAESCNYGSIPGYHRLSILDSISAMSGQYDPMDIAVAESKSFSEQTDSEKLLVAFVDGLDGMVSMLLTSISAPSESVFHDILWMGWEHMNLRYTKDQYAAMKISEEIKHALNLSPLDTPLGQSQYKPSY